MSNLNKLALIVIVACQASWFGHQPASCAVARATNSSSVNYMASPNLTSRRPTTNNERGSEPPASSLKEPAVIINVSSLIANNSLSGDAFRDEKEVSRANGLEDTHNLHLGAKISISILSATIALVAIATLVDCHLDDQSKRQELFGKNKSRTSHRDRGTLKRKQKSTLLRNYRSLSWSSSCSSSICCSINSIASSSIPILQGNHGQQQTTVSSQYNLNLLQQHQSYHQNVVNDSLKKNRQIEEIGPVEIKLPKDDRELESNTWLACQRACLPVKTSGEEISSSDIERKPAAQMQDHERCSASALSLTNSISGSECCTCDKSDQPKHTTLLSTATANNINRHKRIGLEILLAFSLRQSSKQVFQADATAANCGRARVLAARMPEEAANGRQVLGAYEEVREVDEDEEERPPSGIFHWIKHESGNGHYATKIAAASEASGELGHERRAESIDSLHGLRFLSMIWVIVIHSYNFALRWMYFTNGNTLLGIYKSFASQLLANGSFACDSFFFVGGFLLPYLAFNDNGSSSSSSSATKTSGKNAITTATEDTARRPLVGGKRKLNVANGKLNAAGLSAIGCACTEPERIEGACYCLSSSTLAAAPVQISEGQLLRPYKQQVHHCAHLCRATQMRDQIARPQKQQQQQLTLRQLARAHENTNEQLLNCENTGFKCTCSSSLSLELPLARLESAQNCYCKQQAIHQSEQQATKNRTENVINFVAGKAEATSNQEANTINGKTIRRITIKRVLANIVHRYVRMMPLMMSIIGLSATLLRYLGDDQSAQWNESTMMFDQWCRKNWWVNAMFLHNFVHRENMCLSHSWYSAVDLQLFLFGQLILYALDKSRRLGLALLFCSLFASQLLNGLLTIWFHLPAVPLIASVSEQTMNLYYGQIYIKPYCRASPYLIGLLLAYLMRTTSLGELRLRKWQVNLAWLCSLSTIVMILFAMQPAMNGHHLSEWQSALYSSLSRPFWACALAWIIFACITKQSAGIFKLIVKILQAKFFIPLSRLTYPAFLIHPIVMAIFYGSRQSPFHFSHYLMLYLILGNIVITYASAFVLATLFELPLISVERTLSRRFWSQSGASKTERAGLCSSSQEPDQKKQTVFSCVT